LIKFAAALPVARTLLPMILSKTLPAVKMTPDTLKRNTSMALNSVNTNTGALVALQNLNATNNQLNTIQSRINTGLKVASAKDNGATWAIAQNQRATSTSLNAVKDSLQRSQSTIDVALASGESVSDLLVQMKEKALAASESTLDAASRDALNEDFTALRDQISKAVSNAEFNGSNMIKNGGATLAALANATGTSSLTVAAQDLSLGGGNVTVGATASIGSASAAAAMITTLQTSIDNVSAALANLGTGSKSIQNHLTFIGKLQDTIDAGVGNLVDADLAKESAKLQALQTKQQLGIQALSIANSSTSSLLGLFR
jgi:flagellin